jgi:hypothetical protein
MNPSRSLDLFGRAVPISMVAGAFVFLGVLAYTPYLPLGFAADDFIFINLMEGATPFNPWLGFWSVPVDQFQGFAQLWWTPTGSGGALLRPVPSWMLTALYAVFGRNAAPFHLTSALIHGLVAFTAFLLLRRLSGRDLVSLLAALIFLICEDHAMTVAWVATITDLLCALFLNLALLFHVVGREERKPWLFATSLLLFLIAFASKETAAIYPVIVGIYEFFYADRLAGEEHGVGLSARIKLMVKSWWSWAVPFLVFAAYMAFYRSLLPPLTTMMYVDPFSQPARYVAVAVPNLPLMFLALLSPFLPSTVLLAPGISGLSAGIGIVMIVLMIWALLPFRGQRTIWFALAVFAVALLPGLATDPGERLLYVPSIFGFYPVAWLILHVPSVRRRVAPDGPEGVRVLGPVWGWYLLISTMILPVVFLFLAPAMWISGMSVPEKTVMDSLPIIDADRHDHVVYLNTNSSFNTFYLPDIYRYHRDEYVDLRVLSSFNGRVEARLKSPTTVVLRTEDIGWLSNLFARVIRVDPDFDVGEQFVSGTFTAEILRVTSSKRDVLEVEFAFDLPLDHPSVVVLFWNGERYLRWPPTEQWQPLNATIEPYSF